MLDAQLLERPPDLGRDGCGRSCRPPRGYESNAPRDPYRGSSAGRVRRTPPSAPGRSRPCPPPRRETPNRSPPSRRRASRSGRAPAGPRARRAASRPDAASSPAADAARASCRCAPLRGALAQQPLPLQVQLRPGVAPAEAVVLHQMLVKVLGGEALIALAIERLHLLAPGRPEPACPTPCRAGDPDSPASPSSS